VGPLAMNFSRLTNILYHVLHGRLSRVKETDEWKPLRKVDCFALNESKESTVYVDGGRYTADKENGVVRNNFYRAPERQLRSAIWFVRKDAEKKIVEPLSNEDDEQKIEALYQQAVEASSSSGEGIDSVLQEEVTLHDESKVMLTKVNGGTVLCLKKRQAGWLGKSEDLQRGYGAYKVEGEENELMLGEVSDLFFVVHGVGESIWSREDAGMASLIDECDRLRLAIQSRQVEEWRKQRDMARKAGEKDPAMPRRIEFLPIEWYQAMHSSEQALTRTLNSITLPQIPALRRIANEAIFDVMLYLSPPFAFSILECVTSQITSVYNTFLDVHPDFLTTNGGKTHLIGHSLGT